ncbi:MAG: penicillin-binding protein 2 [Alphaproteobacteria bacterium]|nr:penicillin-binding protein 2 [Alphaproteobacteria bacterium]
MREAPTLYQRRIVIGAGICVIAFALVGIRLVHVSLLKGWDAGRAHAPIVARADLTDRNGELLARDLPVKDLYARPKFFADPAGAAEGLAAATGASARRLEKAFRTAKHAYVLVARQITPDDEAKVMQLGLPGLEFEPSAKRYYPDGRTAAQVTGVTDLDNNGISGLELGLQPEIHAAAARGHERGQVATSIDMRVQYILAHELEQARQTFTAKAAGGIVMDVKTGEILGMVSLPDFDPNQRGLAPGDSRRNIMAQDVYELGSVFKIFSFTMALDDHTLNLNEVFPINRDYKVGRYTIHEAERMPATLAARDVLAQSSNIGTSQIVLRSGAQVQRAFLDHMGLLKPVETDLPESARPLYPAIKNWGQIETATIGFGQGISVSPLSFVTAAAEVVNGGRRITPTFLRQNGKDRRGEQVISHETSVKMRDLLRYVVTSGSGKKADIEGYDVGGKTGSAQVPGPNGRYLPRALRTSFFAVFPAHQPRYIVYVLMDQPHGTKATAGFALAGWTAAPAAGRVIERIAPLLGVPKQSEPTRLARDTTQQQDGAQPVSASESP